MNDINCKFCGCEILTKAALLFSQYVMELIGWKPIIVVALKAVVENGLPGDGDAVDNGGNDADS